MAKYSINLLQADLIAKKAFWNLTTVFISWGITLIVMVVSVIWLQNEQQRLANNFSQLNQLNMTQQTRLAELEQQIAKNKQDKTLLDKISFTKTLIANKDYLLQQLTDPEKTYSQGYSGLMTELADLHNRNISLSRVIISGNDMGFVGFAKEPESVPHWLSGFEDATFLAGKRFINFALQENEQRLTEFSVSTSPSVASSLPIQGEE